MKKDLVSMGKFLSLLLRHKPEEIGLKLDEHGWALVQDIVAKSYLTSDDIKNIVATNNKKRYEFSEDGLRIRAVQGHSVEVDLEYTPSVPPTVLYHGTQRKVYDDFIFDGGIKKMSRQHVHLSPDKDTAKIVAKRRKGEIIIIFVKALKMHEDGYKFYLSKNGVWLTDYVPSHYIFMAEGEEKEFTITL